MARILLITTDPGAAGTLRSAGHTVEVVASAHALLAALVGDARLVIADAASLTDVSDLAARCAATRQSLLLLRDEPVGEPVVDPTGARSLRKPVAASTLLAAVAVLADGHGQAALDTLLDDTGRVLLHHPDDAWRDLWTEAFELDGVSCLQSATVPDACQLLMAAKVDVTLALETDADALLAFGRSFGLDVPMVVLSADPADSRDRLLAAGAIAVLDAADPDGARRRVVALIDASDAPHP